MKINIAIADDHQLFLKSLGLLISQLPDFTIIAEALHGKELLEKLAASSVKPDIVLLDVNMPVMDGVTTAKELARSMPLAKVVALSMKDDDNSIISMLRAGVSAYLLKDIHPDELEKALLEIHKTGFYNADAANLNYRRLILSAKAEEGPAITEREKTFLKLACSDLTYKQIASEMHLAERTIDGYRESLFEKLNVQSRTGMVLEAIRKNLVLL